MGISGSFKQEFMPLIESIWWKNMCITPIARSTLSVLTRG
jgi:hypothetical protein